MGKIFAFVNQKGGVGKTTSTINIGAYLAEAGKTVLLVDFDSQANLTSGVGIRNGAPGIYELLANTAKIGQCIRKTIMPGMAIIPATVELSGAAVELIGENRQDFFLKNVLEELRPKYDYILVDCPPSLGVLTINGLVAADGVLIPMQCEYFAMEGLAKLLESISRVQKGLNEFLKIEGIFFTMYDQRTRLAQQVVKQVSVYFKDKVFSTIIPRNVRLSEAPSHGLPVLKYDPKCTGALSYKALTDEFIARNEAEEKAANEE
jgi:chromosome partitioning protein